MLAQLIQDKTEAALKVLHAAKAIKDELSDAVVWPADKQEQFDKAMGEFAALHAEVEQLKKRQEAETHLDAQYAHYTAPVHTVTTRGAEAQAARPSAHREAWHKFLQYGLALCNEAERELLMRGPVERHALISSNDLLGGSLVPDEFYAELISDMAGFAVMRPMCRVRPTVRGAGTFLTIKASSNKAYPSGLAGNWKAEGSVTGGDALTTQNQPTFGRERVPVHIWQPNVIEITPEMLEDPVVDLEAEVRRILAETKSLDEDYGFIAGSGVGMPMGLLNSGADVVHSGHDTNWTYAGLVGVYTALPAQYRQRATWLMNSLTYGLVLLLETSAGFPIFPPNQLPTQILARPVKTSEFMPDGNTHTNKSLVFGDFSYYAIADRRDLRVQRLVERYAPNVALLATARTGGQPLRSNAFIIGDND